MNKKNLLVIGVIVLVAFGIYFYNSEYVDLGSEYNKEDLECEGECRRILNECMDLSMEYEFCMTDALLDFLDCKDACRAEFDYHPSMSEEQEGQWRKCNDLCNDQWEIAKADCLNKYGAGGKPPPDLWECRDNFDECVENCGVNTPEK